MRMPRETWDLVRVAEQRINDAGRRAMAALDVPLTDVPSWHDKDDLDEIVKLFSYQVWSACRPLLVMYDWGNSDNRVDIEDVMHLGRFIEGMREVGQLWVDRIRDHAKIS